MKKDKRLKIKTKIKYKLRGTPNYPRLSVFKSNARIYAQLIDDESGHTLLSASSLTVDQKLTKTEQARMVGLEVAKIAKEKGIGTCKFDRNGYMYHGRVKAVAEGAREGGLKI